MSQQKVEQKRPSEAQLLKLRNKGLQDEIKANLQKIEALAPKKLKEKYVPSEVEKKARAIAKKIKENPDDAELGSFENVKKVIDNLPRKGVEPHHIGKLLQVCTAFCAKNGFPSKPKKEPEETKLKK